jgi:hypothetical protein
MSAPGERMLEVNEEVVESENNVTKVEKESINEARTTSCSTGG